MQSHTAIKWQKVGFKSRQSGAMVCSLNHYAIITSLSTYVSVNNRAKFYFLKIITYLAKYAINKVKRQTTR